MEAEVEITGLAHGGEGVCRIDGQVCFVAYALPGERARVRVVRRAKNVLWAAVEEIIEPSPERETPCCPKFGECGGCTWLNFAYPAQAAWKRRVVHDCLARIAGVDVAPDWAEDADLRLGYRTRARFHAGAGRFGFAAQRSHEVVDIAQCPLCHPALNNALGRVREAGVKDSVELVVHPDGDEVLVWLPHPEARLKGVFPQCGWPGRRGPRAAFIFDGVPVVNGTFSQSSLLLNRVLARVVRELVGEPASLLDLYCGAGNLSLQFAPGARVLGLDIESAAVEAAAALGRGEYRVGDETAFREAIAAEPWPVILLDPPRTGAKAIAAALATSAAAAIVYVSCDPATLARDVKTLAQAGWTLKRAVAVDMFPHTAHVETACRLERQDGLD